MIQPSAFKAYDIRAIVGTELPIEDTLQLGMAIAHLYKEKYNIHAVALGRDGRLSSPPIAQNLIQGLASQGIKVIDLSIVPTPLVVATQHMLNIPAGIMVTASHNPAQYNGVKLSVAGKALHGKDIQELADIYYDFYSASSFDTALWATQDEREKITQEYIENTDSSQKKVTQLVSQQFATTPFVLSDFAEQNCIEGWRETQNFIPHYINSLINEFAHLKNSTRKIIFDCGNGATGAVIPHMLAQLELQNSSTIDHEIDGNFPNREADPTKEKNTAKIRSLAQEHQAIGIAFDGDGDRVVFIDELGRQLTGDTAFTLFAAHIAQNNTVITDVKCSPTLRGWLQQQNITVQQTPCGIGNIMHAMHEHNAPLGGELSSHFCFTDRHPGYDDGIYTALRMIELLEQKNVKLADLVDALPLRCTGQDMRITCPGNRKEIVDRLHNHFKLLPSCTIETIDGISITLPNGSCNIRASNTEPVLSARIEASTWDEYTNLEQMLLQIIEQAQQL